MENTTYLTMLKEGAKIIKPETDDQFVSQH